MGVDKNSTPGAYELLIKNADTLDCIRHTPYGDVIPSNKELSGASVELVRREKREFVLKTRFKWYITTTTTYLSTVRRRWSF